MRKLALLLFACASVFGATHNITIKCQDKTGVNVLSGITAAARESVQINLTDPDYKKAQGLTMTVEMRIMTASGEKAFSFGPYTVAPVVYTGFQMRFYKLDSSSTVSQWVKAGASASINLNDYRAEAPSPSLGTYCWGVEFKNDTGRTVIKEGNQFLNWSATDYDGQNAHAIKLYNLSAPVDNYWIDPDTHPKGVGPIAQGETRKYQLYDLNYDAAQTAGIKCNSITITDNSGNLVMSGPFTQQPDISVSGPAAGAISISDDGQATLTFENVSAAAIEGITVSVVGADQKEPE